MPGVSWWSADMDMRESLTTHGGDYLDESCTDGALTQHSITRPFRGRLRNGVGSPVRKVREHIIHQPGHFREGNLPSFRVWEMDNAVARLAWRHPIRTSYGASGSMGAWLTTRSSGS